MIALLCDALEHLCSLSKVIDNACSFRPTGGPPGDLNRKVHKYKYINSISCIMNGM